MISHVCTDVSAEPNPEPLTIVLRNAEVTIVDKY